MNILKNEKGITLIALVITVILLLILGGVSIMGGTNLVNTAKAETIETDMLTIKAKAKEYMENVDSKNWASKDTDAADNESGVSTKEGKNRKELQDKYQLTLINDENKTNYINYSTWYVNTDDYTYYVLERKAFDKMDLSNIYEEGKVYIIRYPLEDGNTENLEMDIIYANGIKYKDITYYNLSELDKVL